MLINESLELINFDEYMALLAKTYQNAPTFDKKAVPHWKSLIEDVKKNGNKCKKKLK